MFYDFLKFKHILNRKAVYMCVCMCVYMYVHIHHVIIILFIYYTYIDTQARTAVLVLQHNFCSGICSVSRVIDFVTVSIVIDG
jgi:hypothetical protein